MLLNNVKHMKNWELSKDDIEQFLTLINLSLRLKYCFLHNKLLYGEGTGNLMHFLVIMQKCTSKNDVFEHIFRNTFQKTHHNESKNNEHT